MIDAVPQTQTTAFTYCNCDLKQLQNILNITCIKRFPGNKKSLKFHFIQVHFFLMSI